MRAWTTVLKDAQFKNKKCMDGKFMENLFQSIHGKFVPKDAQYF